ncbi:hypothetical protein BGLA2_600010 [Burkholderia gladioli]|nr:hypothetical protein BGLA2_600010 [Burkholderia gladioli]
MPFFSGTSFSRFPPGLPPYRFAARSRFAGHASRTGSRQSRAPRMGDAPSRPDLWHPSGHADDCPISSIPSSDPLAPLLKGAASSRLIPDHVRRGSADADRDIRQSRAHRGGFPDRRTSRCPIFRQTPRDPSC